MGAVAVAQLFNCSYYITSITIIQGVYSVLVHYLFSFRQMRVRMKPWLLQVGSKRELVTTSYQPWGWWGLALLPL